MGHDPEVRLPHVPGHEFAGTVVEVGPEVRRVQVEAEVTVPFACGSCPACAGGDGQVCERQYQPGFSGWGSMAERVAVPRADLNAVRLPDGLEPTTAAILGCRFPTAYRALTSHARVLAQEWLVVLGCGGVGLSAVLIAVARGVRVVAVDVSGPPWLWLVSWGPRSPWTPPNPGWSSGCGTLPAAERTSPWTRTAAPAPCGTR